MTRRVLSEHFARVKSKLLEYSKHFDIADHGDIKGYGREMLVDEFLQTHLPDQIEYLTGEILDPDDRRSGQVDLILQSKRFPKVPLLGNMHLAFSDSVMAVIEVKSNLNKQHLESSLRQFQKIKGLARSTVIHGAGTMADLKRIPCAIFAFKGLSHKTLLSHINDFAIRECVPLEEFAPDHVVVLDSDHYIFRNDGWIQPVAHPSSAMFRHWVGNSEENLVGLYNYLNNITQSFLYSRSTVELGPYFRKLQSS